MSRLGGNKKWDKVREQQEIKFMEQQERLDKKEIRRAQKIVRNVCKWEESDIKQVERTDQVRLDKIFFTQTW